ncbi:HAMP domain-containing sensor histidine kinase [Massilia sp. CFBP9012]|uniref:sensor histidine kinase n=1 Tax=Massilia sp. CFBP9012 TaxID=3096531 RepID=UPI002A6AA560|nr:HAMP domain-containing sensor histidine kinase [Massilia sp. CFBP9012]MDY0974355.1 HAMP domain-containing sensor histidine kinase [Massilia sp. CFBP9012]
MSRRPPSLKRPLIVQPLLFQFAILFICFPLLVALALRADSGGPYTDERITPVIAAAIVRAQDGALALRMTKQLAALRAETPNLWFVAEDDHGRRLSFGQVPAQYAAATSLLRNLSYGHVRDRFAPHALSAVIRREDSPAGPVTILGHGKLTQVGFTVLAASNVAALPIFLLMVLMSLIAIPWIVRRSLAGVARIAAEAECIDVDRRGVRLSQAQVPSEIAPLVRAVNDALGRLDEGYERQRRFIASAAHELRTPIAILRVKVDASLDPDTRRLGSDVERLANLTEQMLDLQRLDTARRDEEIDLAALVRRVAADLAPLLIAADRSIEVEVDAVQTVRGDSGAIERVVTNLVQNAIEHGGRHVVVRVRGPGFEVEDDGPGIPPEERERVFEPFHRLRPRSAGSGLGLHLVQQVVERHGGHVAILGAPGGGTIARVDLAPARPASPRTP